MSDERKIESEVINYSVYQGEQTLAIEVEGNRENRELSHVYLRVIKVGTGKESSRIPIILERAVAEENSSTITKEKTNSLTKLLSPSVYSPKL